MISKCYTNSEMAKKLCKYWRIYNIWIDNSCYTVKDKFKALTNNITRFISEVFQIFKLTIARTSER